MCSSFVPVLVLLLLAVSLVEGKLYNLGVVTADGTDSSYHVPSLLTSLSAQTAAFSSVTLVDASLNSTFANISSFDFLLVFGFNPFAAPQTASVEITQFIDNGGGVVLGSFLEDYSNQYFSNSAFPQEYTILIPSGGHDDVWVQEIFPPYLSAHPVMQGIHNASYFYPADTPQSFSSGSYVVSRFDNDIILVAVKDNVNPTGVNRVDVGLWPVDPYYNGYSDSQTVQLLVNALLYTVSPAFLSVTTTNVTSCVVPDLSTFLQLSSLPANVTVVQSIPVNQTLSAGQTLQVTVTVDFGANGSKASTVEVSCPRSSSTSSGADCLGPFLLQSFFKAAISLLTFLWS